MPRPLAAITIIIGLLALLIASIFWNEQEKRQRSKAQESSQEQIVTHHTVQMPDFLN